jgi:uncharacterized protein YdbL (DUF1318 family)
MSILPLEIVGPDTLSPKNLIIFSKPKVGKTELVSKLDKCLILDFEKGSSFISGYKIQVESVEHLKKIGAEIKKYREDNGKSPYNYVAIDTTTSLEEMGCIYGEQLYSKTAPGKNWFKKGADGKLAEDSGKRKYGNLAGMPEGAGYLWIREGTMQLINFIQTFAPRIILLAHIKEIYLEKDGTTFTASDIDLGGKLKRIVTSASDAIGYMYRKGNKNILTFKTKEDVACGARPSHLRNKELVISEYTEEGLTTNWNEIYID